LSLKQGAASCSHSSTAYRPRAIASDRRTSFAVSRPSRSTTVATGGRRARPDQERWGDGIRSPPRERETDQTVPTSTGSKLTAIGSPLSAGARRQHRDARL